MGYIRHNAIVVTATYEDHIERAHAEAVRIFHAPESAMCTYAVVTEVTPEAMNTTRSFLVGPDGSKEGWALSDEFDARRDTFIEWLRAQAYADGSSPLAWVEVQYGDDELETLVVRDSDEAQRVSA